MDIFGIVIVFVIIGIISSVASAAKKKSSSGEGEPPRRTMSDIQRAFMMMAGEEDEEQQPGQPAQPQRQSYTPPAPRPAYKPPKVYGEGESSYGTNPSQEGFSSRLAAPGSLGKTALEKEAGSNGYTAAVQRVKVAEESIDENELSILHESGGIYGEDLSKGSGSKSIVKHQLKLFSDKNEFVRAVIYSEILSRKSPKRHIR